MNNWDKRFLDLVDTISDWSKDKSTKVGAVIVDDRNVVVSSGWNGFPRGINDNISSRHNRPDKYKWTEHAERNAIYNAAATGVSTLGCTIYLRWYPCCDCARAIIQCGIKRIFASKPDFSNQTWGEDFKIVDEMLRETDISLEYIDCN